MRIAILQKTAPEMFEQLDELLGRRLLVLGSDFTKAGGVQSLAAVMGFVDRETEKNILDGLTKRDPDVANEVKNLLLVFEVILDLNDRAIQRVLKEVDGKDLALSLKTANADLLARIYKNMSTRAATDAQRRHRSARPRARARGGQGAAEHCRRDPHARRERPDRHRPRR